MDFGGPDSLGKPGSLQSDDDGEKQHSYEEIDEKGEKRKVKVMIDFDDEPKIDKT